MPAPFADPTDLEQWLGRGRFDTTDFSRASIVIDYVSALIRSAATIDEAAVPDAVRSLAVTVAARVWDNPTFVQSRVDGPFSVNFGPQVGLYLTDEEKLLLPGPVSPRGVGVLSFTRGPIETPTVEDSDTVAMQDLELE